MNIGEIASRAGVSRSTASYALSGKRVVSEATRRRISAPARRGLLVPPISLRASTAPPARQ